MPDSTGYQRPCPHGDPTCPCQDGDLCHYEATEDTPAMTPPDASATYRQHRGQVETIALRGGDVRFVASCWCGWGSGLFLTAMQAHAVAVDHVGAERGATSG